MSGISAQEILQQGHALLSQGRLADAETVLRHGIGPGGTAQAPVLHLLSLVLRMQGKLDETRLLQERLVEALPGNYVYRFDLAETLLLLGDFERGWREYDYRYNLPHTFRLERKVQRPRWDYRPLDGRTILIHDEQGYGDSFQFLRLVPRVKERGGRVILQVHPDLMSFAKRMSGYDELLARGEAPPPFDLHAELMSLPLILGLKPSDLPGPMPYLSVDPARLEKWRRRLASLPRPLVATVWAGRPAHLNDHNRSMTLEQLAPLGAAGVTFVSIQKGPKSDQAKTPPPGLSMVSLSDEIADFDDTAAILSLVDLLISVDSSPVHLAGALGRPAWVLLPFIPDWRWLMGRDDTPWYPTVRLFRQQVRGDWTSAIASMAQALTQWRQAWGPAAAPVLPSSAQPAAPARAAASPGGDLFQQGFAHLEAGRFAEAEALFLQIVSRNSVHAESLHLLGVIAHQRGQYDAALHWMGRAISVQPLDPRYHTNRGCAFRRLGHLGSAEACQREALRLLPGFAEAHHQLGVTLREAGRPAEATASFREALRLRPDFPEARRDLDTLTGAAA